MKYQIDQSIKIENTSKKTYVSIVNSKTITISISAKDKRLLKLFYREMDKPLIFKIFTFSVLCAKAIINSGAKSVEIDREYSGHEIDIKSFITQILLINKISEVNIVFKEVGKNSRSHLAVYAAMSKKQKVLQITAKEVLYYYEKIDKP